MWDGVDNPITTYLPQMQAYVKQGGTIQFTFGGDPQHTSLDPFLACDQNDLTSLIQDTINSAKDTTGVSLASGVDFDIENNMSNGTDDTVKTWGPEETFQGILDAQSEGVTTVHELYPDIVSEEDALEISSKAKIGIINPDRIREIEDKTGHDVIAVTTALDEQLKRGREHPGKYRTSADSTETI